MKNCTFIFPIVPDMSNLRLSPEERENLYDESNIDHNHPFNKDEMVDARLYRI